MIAENLAASILTASVTGAGLVIAFYALLAHMSDRIFESRFEMLDEKNREAERILEGGLGKDENLRAKADRLKELGEEIDSIKTFPRYLGPVVAIDFGLFLFTAMLSLNWLFSSVESRARMNDWMIPLLFFLSIALFLSVGIYGITDVMGTMKYQFEKIRKKKEKVKEEIRKGPAEANARIRLVEEALTKIGVDFQRTPMIKKDGTILVPDFAVPSGKNPKFLIEVVTRPNADLIYSLSAAYQSVKVQQSAKTLIISDFGSRLTLLDVARTYWDHVIDLQNLDKLKEILER